MTQANLLELSKHGDPKAIAQLINRAVQPLKITVKASVEGRRLIVFAEGQEAPNQQSLVRIIQRGIVDLDTEVIDTFKVYGRKTGNSVSSWTQEVVLRLPQVVESPIKATKTNGTSALSSIPIQQITNLIETLFKRILNIRIRKKVITWFLASVLFVLAATGSVVGFKLFRSRSLQAETVTKAQTLTSRAGNISKAPNLDSLKASEVKLKQAGILLASVPDSPGGLYSQAQSKLTKVHSQLDEIEQRIKVEEEAVATFKSQDRIAQIAIESVKTPPHSLAVWQQAKTKLEQANTSLSSIPKETFVYEQVKAKSPSYKKSYVVITQALSVEEKANKALLAAETAAEQAMAITKDESSYSVEMLQDAESKWQKAISLLKKVPPKAEATLGVSDRMKVYTGNYKVVSNGVKEIRDCMNQDIEGLDSCENIYIDLSVPSSTTDEASTTSE